MKSLVDGHLHRCMIVTVFSGINHVAGGKNSLTVKFNIESQR